MSLSLELMQSMHYDMEDLLEQANEIQESMGRSYAVPDEIDEADLEAGPFGAFPCKHLLNTRSQNWMP
jgi:charged multivesicular body protein 5